MGGGILRCVSDAEEVFADASEPQMSVRASNRVVDVFYDETLEYFYFENGVYPQSFVGTTLNNTLNSAYTAGAESFSVKMGSQTCPVFSYQNNLYMRAMSTINKTLSLNGESVSFENGKNYWFKVEPIRWRVSAYGVEKSECPSIPNLTSMTWDTRTQDLNFAVVSDLVLNWGASGNLEMGQSWTDGAGAITLTQNWNSLNANQTLLSGSLTMGIDRVGDGSTNVKVNTERVENSTGIFYSSLEEIDTLYDSASMQDNSHRKTYASDLVCMFMGINDTDYCQYATRTLYNNENCRKVWDGGLDKNLFLDTNFGSRLTFAMNLPANAVFLQAGTTFNKTLKGGSSYTTSNTTTKKVVFDYYTSANTYAPNGTNLISGLTGVAIGLNEDNRIMAYGVGTGTVYVLSNYHIMANELSSYYFYYLDVLSAVEFDNFNTSKTTWMSYMFYHAGYSANDDVYLDFSDLDFSSLIHTKYMFGYAFEGLSDKYECIIDFNSLSFPKLTDVEDMFYASKVATVDFSNCDFAVLEDTSYMFSHSGIEFHTRDQVNSEALFVRARFTKLKRMSKMFYYSNFMADFSSAYLPNSVNANQMFAYSTVTELDLAVISLSSSYYMFDSCSYLTKINGIEQCEMSKCTDLRGMFSECSLLKSANLSNWNVSSARSAYRMFYGCSGLTSVNLWTGGRYIETYEGMFQGCSLLENIDLSTLSFESAYRISEMFYNCQSLKTVIGPSAQTTSAIHYMPRMFYGCRSLENVDLSGFKTNSVVSMAEMFKGCLSLKTVNVSTWNTKNVEYMGSMFEDCESLITLDLTSFDGDSLLNVNYMFAHCKGLKTITFASDFSAQNIKLINSMFSGCHSLTAVDLTGFNTSNVTSSMNYMFRNCYELVSLDLSSFNTRNVNDMTHMFSGCESLTTITLSSNFVSTNLTNTKYMFYDCYALKNIDLSNFSTSNIKNMSYMFYNCKALQSIKFSTSFTAIDVWNMDHMFYNCASLTSLDLSKFNTVDVQNMRYMFYNCIKLKTLTLSSNFVVSRCEDMDYMFYDCEVLTGLDLSSFGYSPVVNARYMFYDCHSLTSLNLSNFETPYLKRISYMFADCRGLTSLLLTKMDTSNVQYMEYTFYNCKNVIALDLSSFDMSKVQHTTHMFSQCLKLESITFSTAYEFNSLTKMRDMFNACKSLKSLDLSMFNTSNVENMQRMFSECESLETITFSSKFVATNADNMTDMFYMCKKLKTVDLSSFGSAPKLTTTNNMFDSCSAITTIYLNNFNAPNLTSMKFMFSGCAELTTLKLNSFSTASVTTMHCAFDGCKKLQSLYLYWNTSNVTDMSYMFRECRGLKILDLSNFDASKVTTMQSMFNNCKGLENLTFSSRFNTANVTNMKEMFVGVDVTAIKGIAIFDTSKVTTMYGMFRDGRGFASACTFEYWNFNTANVTTMRSMFWGFGKATSTVNTTGDVHDLYYNTSKVTNMRDMFREAYLPLVFDLSSFTGEKVSDLESMFDGCKTVLYLNLANLDLVGSETTKYMFYDCTRLNAIFAHNWNLPNSTKTEKMFYNCTNLYGYEPDDHLMYGYDPNNVGGSWAMQGYGFTPPYLWDSYTQTSSFDEKISREFIFTEKHFVILIYSLTLALFVGAVVLHFINKRKTKNKQ